MNDKRHLLRRVTAFTTAFVFLCRFASAGVAGAAEVTGSISTGKASSVDDTTVVMPVTQAPTKAEPSKGSSAAVTGKSSSEKQVTKAETAAANKANVVSESKSEKNTASEKQVTGAVTNPSSGNSKVSETEKKTVTEKPVTDASGKVTSESKKVSETEKKTVTEKPATGAAGNASSESRPVSESKTAVSGKAETGIAGRQTEGKSSVMTEAETSDSKQEEFPVEVDEGKRLVRINISVKGSSVLKPLNVIENLFAHAHIKKYSTMVAEPSDGAYVDAVVFGDIELEDQLWNSDKYQSGEDVFFNVGDVHYRLDSLRSFGREYELRITECYDTEDIPFSDAVITPYDSKLEKEKLLPHGTMMKFEPAAGWKISYMKPFPLTGSVSTEIRQTGGVWYLFINSGENEYRTELKMTGYSVETPAVSGLSFDICGSGKSVYNGFWKNEGKITVKAEASQMYKSKIYEMNLVSQTTGEKYPMKITGDGKSVTASVNVEDINSGCIDGETFKVDIRVIPDNVKLNTFIVDDNGETLYEAVEYGTSVTDDQKNMLIDPILYKDGVAAYIIDSYEVDGKTEKVDSKKIFDEQKFYEPIVAPYDFNGNVIYKEIVLDENLNYEVMSNCIPQNKSNVYSLKLTRTINVLKFNKNTDAEKKFLFNTINQSNDIERRFVYNDSNFIYTFSSEKDSKFTALNINSILYYEDGEFHNMLTEPLYFYFDEHAPKMELADDLGKEVTNDLWASNIYEFKISADDAEAFAEVSGAGDEVNSIYRNINGSSSPITKITVGESVLTFEDGKWVEERNSDDVPYTVSVTQTAENKFDVAVELLNGKGIFDENVNVTVTDKCGNTSEAGVINLKFENEAPVVTSMKLRGAVIYDHPEFGKTAGVGIEARGDTPDTALLDVEFTEKESGFAYAVLMYGNQDFMQFFKAEDLMKDPAFNFRKEGDKYGFTIPVPAAPNYMSPVRISVYDNARNGKVYYYNSDLAPVTDRAEATKVVFDASLPDAEISVAAKPDHTDAKKHRWYKEIPEFAVKADDTDNEIESGVRFIEVTAGDVKFKTEDLSGTGITDLKVTGVLKENSDKADIYCTVGEKSVLAGTVDLALTGGEFKVTAVSEDGAGNRSKAVSETVFVDCAAPAAEKFFTLENENDNYRAFGTFLNHGTKITVKVSEPEGRPSSGLKSATASFCGKDYYYEFDSALSADAEFNIPFDEKTLNSESGTLKVTVTDNTGNTYSSGTLVSTSGSGEIIFENIPPVINENPVSVLRDYLDEDSTSWYSTDVPFDITADDTLKTQGYSGLKTSEVVINGKKIRDDNFRNEKTKTSEKNYTFSTADADEKDGKFDVIVRAEDNAGNKSEFRKTVCVDKTAPVVTDMFVDGVGSVPAALQAGIFAGPFGHFFKESVTLTVYAVDKNVSSGLKSIELTMYDHDGFITDRVKAEGAELKFDAETGNYSADFVIPEGFRGYLSASASDNVELISEAYSPEGFITENEERHGRTSSVDIVMPETAYTDRNGLPLYASDINAKVNAEDSFSGIRSIEWNLSEYGDNKWLKRTAGKDGTVTGDELPDFEVFGKEKNLVLSAGGRAVITEDKNSGRIRLRMTDNTGNTSETEKKFSIDRKAPAISVSYEKADADEQSGIFSAQRTAVVSVTERNFDPERIKVNVEGNEGGVSFGNWSHVSGEEGTDNAVYRMPVTFSGDGSYVLKAEGTDMCDNKASDYTSEQFIIDRTAPVMEVSSSGAEAVNGNFYNGERKLTVRITEHNFDPSRVKITGTKDGAPMDFGASFTSSGDVHTAVLSFVRDGDYTVSVEGMDAAGNVFEGYSDSFTVDSEAPVITFNGVTDKSANRGEISLDVSIDDVNISSDDISVSFSGAERGDLSANAGVLSSTDDGFKFTFGEFPEEQGIDDIYTVTVSAKDDAENYSEETLTFSVNRFGSNYYFDKSALEIAGTYVREPVDIVLHEINVDPLDMEKTMVTVMRDGNPKILEKDKDYELEVSGGDGSWCEYCYDIKAKNFSDDAAYNVVVMTEDAAGNLNANSEAGKKAEFKFGVDGTPPKCIPVNIETGCALRADRLTVNLKCEDNIMLDTLDVYVDDVHTEEQYVKGSPDFSFTLLSSDKPQTVRIDISDVAGNKTEMLIENILISTSFVKVAVRSVWTKAAACLAAAGGIAAFAVRSVRTRKRRKRLGL